MPTYLSPGVYVEEISSGSAPIASLGTSTAGFIGVVPDAITIPIGPVIQETDNFNTDAITDGIFALTNFPVIDGANENYEVFVDSDKISDFAVTTSGSDNDKQAQVEITPAPTSGKTVTVKYIVLSKKVTNEVIHTVNVNDILTKDETINTTLKNYPVNEAPETWEIQANGDKLDNTDDSLLDITLDTDNKITTVTVSHNLLRSWLEIENENPYTVTESIAIRANYQITFPTFTPVDAGEVKLCTNFNEFKKYFGDFSLKETSQKQLAHAVYGFFNNGGSRCYVSRVTAPGEISGVLEKFEAIDEIAIVAAPGISDPSTRSAIVTHCTNMGDRFAILDCKPEIAPNDIDTGDERDNSNYAAYYFPWIKVSDPASKMINPNAKGEDTYLSIPPSGHIAGVYARVDAQRGVHKAPANEVIFGALGLEYKISKNQQMGLNPQGINCIRDLNGNIRIWGARTVGGDANGEFKYINVRRLFLSIRDSLEEGTQWTVFEPNDMELWAKIRRNVNAYLTNVWRSGALFGATPQEAFFVKCDAENNPPEVRDLGQVVIEIGVAPVKPAEFVIFRISQWAGSGN